MGSGPSGGGMGGGMIGNMGGGGVSPQVLSQLGIDGPVTNQVFVSNVRIFNMSKGIDTSL